MLPFSSSFSEIQAAAQRHARDLDSGAQTPLIDALVPWVAQLLSGRHPDYQALDLHYHGPEHIRLTSTCFLNLAIARRAHGIRPSCPPRDFELGLAAILLHDSGYLKLRSDTEGTGAKYTFSHVLRGQALAASVLPAFGCSPPEIRLVLAAIHLTGPPDGVSAAIRFDSAIGQQLGCMVASADYLGQMADPHYVEKLPALYSEFEEACRHSRIPPAGRAFASVEDLFAQTPGFWEKTVRPKLEHDFRGVHRWLTPDGDSTNPYLTAIESNINYCRTRR